MNCGASRHNEVTGQQEYKKIAGKEGGMLECGCDINDKTTSGALQIELQCWILKMSKRTTVQRVTQEGGSSEKMARK